MMLPLAKAQFDTLLRQGYCVDQIKQGPRLEKEEQPTILEA